MNFTNTKITCSALLLFVLLLSACGGGGGSSASGTTSYTVGGTVSGLGDFIVLQDNGSDNLTIAANGTFTFSTKIDSGGFYKATVLTQSTGQTCSVSMGAGTVSEGNVTNVSVICSNNSYNVGGTISGLTGSVVLQDNNGDNFTVATNGIFTFATKVANGSPYNVSVLTQPAGQTCTVSSGVGTVSGGNVANVSVICSNNSYSVGGQISGLTDYVVLQNNNGDNLTVAANGVFNFSTKVANGSPYKVSVFTQPTGQNCSVAGGTGTIAAVDATNVTISCTANTYTIGGSVTGLSGSVVLQNNGADNHTVAVNGPFTFATTVAYGNLYSVSVLTQPVGQTCSVSTGAGTVPGGNVNNVSVVCSNNSYSVGGTISGLLGSVVLQDNNGDNLTVAANGIFTFATKVASGSPYSVTVFTQPTGQSCSLATNTGTIAVANVTSVAVTCASNTYTIGGTVYFSSRTSMVMQDNGSDNLTVSVSGPFIFATAVAYGNLYNATVLTQPYNMICPVTGGAGIVSGNVTNVSVTCSCVAAVPTNCSGTCVNTTTDANNCGRCGAVCASGVCIGSVCKTATCSDGVKNGLETDVDCGGGTCIACGTGQTCKVGTDCVSGVCLVTGLCQ